MKLAFFDAKPYDRESFDRYNAGRYEIRYFETRLTAAALWLAWLAVIVLLSLHGNTGTSSVVEDVVMLLSFAGVEVLALAAFDLSSPSGPTRRVLLDRPRSRLRRACGAF